MPTSRKRHISDSDDESIFTNCLSNSTISITNSSSSDPLDTDCKLLMETCQLYGSALSSLNEGSTLSADSDSGDDLEEICLEGDVDYLQRILSADGGALSAPPSADKFQLTAEEGTALLNLNKAYQKTIERRILMIQTKIHYLRTKQAELRGRLATSAGYQKQCYMPSQKDCCPFFQDSLRRGPEISDYAKTAAMQSVELNVKRSLKPFSLEHTDVFNSAVANQIRSQLLKEPLRTIEKLRRDEDRDDVEYSETLEAIETISNMDQDELLSREDVYQFIDWNEISARNEWAPSATSCRSLWNNLLKPSINRSNWTMEETKNLLAICEHLRSWQDIADVLDTRRSAYLCMKRYMEKEPSRDSSQLSALEQKELAKIVAENRIGYYVLWNTVAYLFQKRCREVLFSICITIEEGVKKARWTTSETEMLMKAVRNYGFARINWLEISRYIPGRSATMCSRRYHVVCKKQLRQRDLLNVIAKLYDEVKASGGPIRLDSNVVLSSQMWCILNACSLNEVIYKWLRAQRDSIRHFLLTYYKNQRFQGPIKTPMGNLIYPQPVINVKPSEMGILSTERAKEAIEMLLALKEKGIRPVLPSISNLIRMIDEEKDAKAVFERIQEFTTRTESVARQKNLWQLQHFQYTAKYRKDRIEYLHCMAGSCYMRREAQVESEVSDLIDDMITGLMIFGSLQTSDRELMTESLKKATKMLGLMQDFLLTGVLPFSSNVRLSDLSQMVMHCIQEREDVVCNPMVLAASYIWAACESAKCCGNSHKMTARYLHPDRRGWPCYRDAFYEDKTCVVCPKFNALMHKRLPERLLNSAKLVNFFIGGYMNEELKFVGTSIRQHMLTMYHRIALIPTRRAKHQITREVRRTVTQVVIDLVNKVVERWRRPDTRKVQKRRKIPKLYKRSFNPRFNVKNFKNSAVIAARCDSEKGAALIDRVTKAMNEDKRNPVWLRRQTRLIYSVISAMVIRVEKVIMLTGIRKARSKGEPDKVRRSARLQRPEKSRPWLKFSEGRDVPYARRRYKPRKATNKKLGRPSNEDKLKKLQRRKKINEQIFLQADFVCTLSQTERFAFCSRVLSMDVQSLLDASKLFTQHYRRINAPMTNRMAHCVSLRLSADTIPDEVEAELSSAFQRCLFTIVNKEYLDLMVQWYISTVNSIDSQPTEKMSKRKIPSVVKKVLGTRRQSIQIGKLLEANFTSAYWQPAIWRNIDVQSYSTLRHRLRTMFYPVMKKMITERDNPESAEKVSLLNDATESVKAALQCFNEINATSQ